VPELFHDAFYRFVRVTDPESFVTHLERTCLEAGVLGSILIASEGINGMLCGSSEQLQRVRDHLEADSRFAAMTYKRTVCTAQVFKRLKIKRRKEIVPLGLEGVDATTHRGVDISPEQWRNLLKREDVIVIDNRNSFEFQLGRFKGAINPGVDNFRDFAAYLESKLPEWQGKQIAMYCTGGIRCEKTTAWLAQRGLEVWQLEGGILNYFQCIPNAELDYEGTCFVFDERRELDTQNQAVPRE
jgi:UPF0176 protein